MKARVLVVAVAIASLAAGLAAAQEDPFLWLEEVEGERALQWVQERNAETLSSLGEHPAYEDLYDDVLEILTAEDRIAYPSTIGDDVYNFWTGTDHPRGIYRRTSLDSYLSGDPEWETVLDIDALSESEGVPWAFRGMSCLTPEYRHCMVNLSRGGADATEAREFDLPSATFVEDGFLLPEAKSSIAWVDSDTLLVGTDFGPGSMTESGYARTAGLWRRNTPLADAETVFEAEESDMGIFVGAFQTQDGPMPMVIHRPAFFDAAYHVYREGGLERIDIPSDADPGIVGDQLVVYVRDPWEVDGTTYPTGSVIAIDLDAFLAGERNFTVVLEPGPRSTVQGTTPAGDTLLVSTLDNVQGQLWKYRLEDGEWIGERVEAPGMGSVGIVDIDIFSERFFFTYSSFTQPTTLYLHDDEGSIHQVRQSPTRFDATDVVIQQHETTSLDGTTIPYFVMADRDVPLDGSSPTLLYGYGGFEVSMQSSYSALRGKAWIERGGVYAVANIRGGGEFGPEWHRAALKENRQRAYDDFIAVSEDLIRRGYTSPEHLGIEGGSNGGLLTGVAMTQRPDLYEAVIISVPLLDMRRYNKLLAGASWMAEYGNPDLPEEWAYISRYSPYQNVHPDRDYPTPFINTTTRDDRVHPGHARKMAAKMLSQGHDVIYYENTEGGHGAGVTPEQRARMIALEYAYLWSRLGDGDTTTTETGAAGEEQADGEEEKTYEDVITDEAESDEGLFTVHRVADKWYFEIPESHYGKDMLLVSRIARVPAGFGGFIVSGTKVGEQVLRWERRDDRILLRKISFTQVADEEEPIHQSVVKNNFPPIVAAFDVEVEGPEGDTVVIDVTDFYSGDTPLLSGLSSSQRREYEVRRLDGDRSFIDRVDSYPLNVDVRHTLTYDANDPPGNNRTGTISMQMHQSMVLLPEEPMTPRLADHRVGYFSITQVNFGLDELKAAEQTFIRRWRLEPSDPEAYAAGETVDPVEPIVYWIDPATPARWRPYVKQGVEDWQAAFETAGFSNAIVAREPPSPEEDPDWAAEDVRHSVVRWAASMVRNAMGPSVSDPRTGEIIESDIVWYHNHLRSYRNRLMIETGAANPAARSLDIDEELMGETVRQVIAHEIGHAIGLPHNMIASSSYPTESLRDPEFARRMGVAPSVMDYARQNYVAQPGDGLEPTDFIRKIGPYDHYAVNWGYRVIADAETPEDEKATLDEWILERADDPMYRFGSSTGWNPDAQTEDMGDDPVASSGYGIANLQRVVPNLIEWTSTPGKGFDDLEEIYNELVFQWNRYVGHVVTVVGGRFENAKSADQGQPVYTMVSRDEQEAAVGFLVDEVLQTPLWLIDTEILSRIEHAGAVERIRSRQVSVLNQLLEPRRMQRVIEAATLDPDAYSLGEYMAELKAGVFSELTDGGPIDTYRRNLQRAYVERLEYLLTEEPEPLPPFILAFLGNVITRVDVSTSDIRPLARSQLREIQREAETAVASAQDPTVRAHLEDLAARVESILDD